LKRSEVIGSLTGIVMVETVYWGHSDGNTSNHKRLRRKLQWPLSGLEALNDGRTNRAVSCLF